MPEIVQIGRDRVTQVDGRPFFLIGARHMPEGGTPEILRDAGFNAFRQQCELCRHEIVSVYVLADGVRHASL